MSKRKLILGVAALALLVGGGLVAAALSSAPSHFSAQGASFDYPRFYDDQTFMAPKAIIAQLKQPSPESIITLSLEKKADFGAKISKVNVLDYLESSAVKSFPSKYKGFAGSNTVRIKIDGFDASELSFNYQGGGNKTIAAKLLIVPRGHDAYYLTIESQDKNRLESDYKLVRDSLNLP